MHWSTVFSLTLLCASSAVTALPAHHHHNNKGGGAAAAAGGAATSNSTASAATAASASTAATSGTASTATTSSGGAVTSGSSTEVLFEVNGVPGNQCLTFRNNGEIVDAACVDDSADRQMTPSTNAAGAPVLLVQRTFTADFRPDLVGVQACVGNNGTDFLAQDCATATDLVQFTGGELKAASGACASGHDSLAQMTVDETGATCATYTSTTVTPVTD